MINAKEAREKIMENTLTKKEKEHILSLVEYFIKNALEDNRSSTIVSTIRISDYDDGRFSLCSIQEIVENINNKNPRFEWIEQELKKYGYEYEIYRLYSDMNVFLYKTLKIKW